MTVSQCTEIRLRYFKSVMKMNVNYGMQKYNHLKMGPFCDCLMDDLKIIILPSDHLFFKNNLYSFLLELKRIIEESVILNPCA